MYTKKLSKLGTVDIVSFHNQDHSFGLEIIPSHGALIKTLTLNGKNIIDGPQNEAEILQNDWYKSTFLAPFPNRIEDGVYHYDGKQYQLPINEEGNNNALHGLVYKAPFTIVDEKLDANRMSITLQYIYNGENAGYPFAFTTLFTLSIDEEKGFSCEFNFSNQAGQSIPFGYGWHPYFQLGNNVDAWKIEFPPAKQFKVNGRMIPTGEIIENRQFATLSSLNGVNLDDCFELIDQGGIAKTKLVNEEGFGITLWQETGNKKLNFLQIFTPPHRSAIAIEPQTSCIDAFNNKFGLFELAENESLTTSFGIELNT